MKWKIFLGIWLNVEMCLHIFLSRSHIHFKHTQAWFLFESKCGAGTCFAVEQDKKCVLFVGFLWNHKKEQNYRMKRKQFQVKSEGPGRGEKEIALQMHWEGSPTIPGH